MDEFARKKKKIVYLSDCDVEVIELLENVIHVLFGLCVSRFCLHPMESVVQ